MLHVYICYCLKFNNYCDGQKKSPVNFRSAWPQLQCNCYDLQLLHLQQIHNSLNILRLRLKTLVLSISYTCYFTKVNENLAIDYCIILFTDTFWHILVVTEIKMK